MKRHHEPPVVLYFTLAVFLADLRDSPFRCFVWITKFTFHYLTLIIAQVLKEKWFWITVFLIHNNKQTCLNEAANDSARVSGQDRKKTARSRNQSDCRMSRIPPARKLRKNNLVLSKLLRTKSTSQPRGCGLNKASTVIWVPGFPEVGYSLREPRECLTSAKTSCESFASLLGKFSAKLPTQWQRKFQKTQKV